VPPALMVSRPVSRAGGSLDSMAETAMPRGRAVVRVLAFGVPLLVAAVGLAMACAETRAPVGGACLKSEDCLTGICSQLVCVTAPPLIDAELDAEPSEGGGVEAASPDAPSEAAPPAPDAAAETGPEASSSGGETGAPEASGD
jgi:hypothetical protein